MPFTPLHMGPGIAIKAAMQSRFSLMVFGWSQIIIDIQPLIVLITGKGALHGFTHTYLGATLIALFSALSGKYLGEVGLCIVREQKYLPIGWSVAFISAFIGAYSHVFIDSIMHADIQPFAPFVAASPLHGILSIEALHGWCVASAIAGGAIFFVVDRQRKKA